MCGWTVLLIRSCVALIRSCVVETWCWFGPSCVNSVLCGVLVAASMARHLYIRAPAGVGSFIKIYGGKSVSCNAVRYWLSNMGRSQKLCNTFVTWKPKVKMFYVISKNIPNNSRIHIIWWFTYLLCCVSWILFFTFWFAHRIILTRVNWLQLYYNLLKLSIHLCVRVRASAASVNQFSSLLV